MITRQSNGHNDAGLQPERTLLAWARTLLSMLVASLLFLRWMPHHGILTAALIGLSLVVALLIWVSQQQRYHRRVEGIARSSFAPDVGAVLGLGSTVTLISAVALWILL